MEQRLAALRKEIEEKKKKSSSASPEGQVKPGGAGGQQGGTGSDEESARWFNAVKSQVKSHWSLTADPQQIEKLKVTIGVKVAENGDLRGVSVDIVLEIKCSTIQP